MTPVLGESYFSKALADKIGYEQQEEPKEIPLAVKGKNALLMGDTVVSLEIEGILTALSIIAVAIITGYQMVKA